ncbi:MAG: TIGR04086 family membrane protein [Bacillota bacterium]
MKKDNIEVGGGCRFHWGAIVGGLGIAYGLLILFAIVLGLVMFKTAVPDAYLPWIAAALGVLALLFGAIGTGRRTRDRGLLHGAVLGVVYVVIALLLTFFLTGLVPALADSLIRLAIGLGVGAIGGMLGVNL